MRKLPIVFLAGFSALVFSPSCKTIYQPVSVQYADYRLNQSNAKDSAILVMLKPYADSVHNSMNDIVGVAAIVLEKKQPEGTLGNFLVDAMLLMAKEKYQVPIDAAFLNDGGIRLPSLAAGNITRGKIFELSPFDNIIILQKLNGKVLQQFLDHVSESSGWPGAGVTWQIKNKKAVNVMVNGSPINEATTYTVAILDYLANGGDDCNMLRPFPQISNGYVFRNAIFDYLKRLSSEGKAISAKVENRVTNAE